MRMHFLRKHLELNLHAFYLLNLFKDIWEIGK